MTLIINCKEFLPKLYDYCLREQLEVFTYSTKDRVHINLTKHLIIIDTIIRMISSFDQLLQEVQANSVLLLHNLNEIVIKPLPLSTVITTIGEIPVKTNRTALMQSLCTTLTKTNRLSKREKEFYETIVNFINKKNALTREFQGMKYNSYSSINYDMLSNSKLSYCIDRELSYKLAPFQMRLTKNEILSCFNIFISTLVNTSRDYKCKVVRLTDKRVSKASLDNDLYTYATHLFKHTTKYIFVHDQSLVSKASKQYKYSLLVDKNIEHYAYDFNKLILKESITNNLNIQQLYNLYIKCNIKSVYNYELANNFIKYTPYERIKVKVVVLSDYLKKLDNYYRNTLMYINTYAKIGFDSFEDLYINKTFKAVLTDTFDDIDLAFCTYDSLLLMIQNIIDEFHRHYRYTLIIE